MLPIDEPELKAAKQRAALERVRAAALADGASEELAEKAVEATRNAFMQSALWSDILAQIGGQGT